MSGLERIRSVLIVSCVHPIPCGSLLIHPSAFYSTRLRVLQEINISAVHFRMKLKANEFLAAIIPLCRQALLHKQADGLH